MEDRKLVCKADYEAAKARGESIIVAHFQGHGCICWHGDFAISMGTSVIYLYWFILGQCGEEIAPPLQHQL